MTDTVAATGLPQYSWGYDPSTQSWGYFMNKAGSLSDQIGRKAGDKLASYKAPAGDAASMQQAALEHLMNQQASAALVDPTVAAAAAAPAVSGSGIATALGNQGGHGSSGDSGPTTGAVTSGDSYDKMLAALGNYGESMPGTSITGNLASGISNALAARNDGYSAMSGPNGYADARDAAAKGLGVGNTDPNGTSAAQQSTDNGWGREADSTAPDGSADASAQANGNTTGDNYGNEGSRTSSSDGGGDTGGGDTGGAQANGNTTGGNYGNEGSRTSSNEGGGDTGGGGDGKTGGIAINSRIRHFADGGQPSGLGAAAALPGRFIRGPGDGQSDSIPVKMDDGGQGRLADNEFVWPADVVSALGNGSSEAGARELYAAMDRIRQAAHGKTAQQKPVNPAQVLPA